MVCLYPSFRSCVGFCRYVWVCRTRLQAVNPQRLQILEDDRWRHNARHMTSFVQKYSFTPIVTNLRSHKTCEKDVVGIVTFDLIGLLPTKRPIALLYYIMAYWSL